MVGRSRYLAFLLSLFLILSSMSLTAFATVQTTSVSIYGVMQEETRWCWAACAETCGKVSYPNSPYTQEDVVIEIKGGAYNTGGSADETRDGTNFVAEYRDIWKRSNSALSFSSLTTKIAQDRPVIALLVNSSYNHAVVVYMTQFIDNSSGEHYYIDYFDPEDGATYHIAYEDFCDIEGYSKSVYCS